MVSRIDGNRIKGWWTTRQKPPLRVTSADKVTREVFDVFHWAWGSKPGTNPRGAIDNLYIKLFGRRGEPKLVLSIGKIYNLVVRVLLRLRRE